MDFSSNGDFDQEFGLGQSLVLRIGHGSDELSSDIKPTFLEPFWVLRTSGGNHMNSAEKSDT